MAEASGEGCRLRLNGLTVICNEYEALIKLDLVLASRRMNISLAKCIYPCNDQLN